MNSIQKEYKDILFHGRPPRVFLYSFLFLFAIIIPQRCYASVASEVNKANDFYKQGKLDDSLDLYQKALDQGQDSPVVKYDLGTAFYKKGDYDKALGYLEQAAGDKNIKIKPRAEYNLGNVLYKKGIQNENTNVDQAIKSLKEALSYYGRAIVDEPNDPDTVFNREFVKKEIERLKEKKQQQQQNQQQKDQKHQDQKNQQHQQQRQQDQQNQQGQQGQKNEQKNQEPQQDRQGKKGRQEQQDQKGQEKKRGEQQQRNPDQGAQDQKSMERKQAEDMLEDYQENEEPKKLLNYMPKKIDDRPVLKDW